MPQHLPTPRIPEERVAAILARAAEIDKATRETFDLDSIRTAAMEAGIGRAAIDLAIEEYATGELDLEIPIPAMVEPPRKERRWKRLARKIGWPLAQAFAALSIGIFLGEANEEALIMLGLLGWFVFAARQAWRRRPVRRARGYIATQTLVAAAALAGFAAGNGDEDALVFGFFFAAALLFYGSAFIKVRLGWMVERVRQLGQWIAPAT